MFSELINNEDAAAGLPIRIVVLTIIGMIGFGAITAGIMSAPQAPQHMYATSDVSSIELYSDEGDSGDILVTIRGYDDKVIPGSTVVMRGPSGNVANGGNTDISGQITLNLYNISLPAGKQEGYISVKVMAQGYIDHEDRYFIKVIRR